MTPMVFSADSEKGGFVRLGFAGKARLRARLAFVVGCSWMSGGALMSAQEADRTVVTLPGVEDESLGDLMDALRGRRSAREFAAEPLTLRQVSLLLSAAQGLTHPDGLRSVPSAGALYPLEVYLVAGVVEGLSPGVYLYRPGRHDLVLQATGDRRGPVARAAVRQGWMAAAAATIVLAADYGRTTPKYGERGRRYVHIEVGHAGQNVAVVAAALGLGTVFVGAFDDERVRMTLEVPRAHHVLGLMPVGAPR